MNSEVLEIPTNNFEEKVLSYVATKGMSFIDAVLQYCKEYELEPDYIKNIITPPIKQKLEGEYRALNMLDRDDTEPLPVI